MSLFSLAAGALPAWIERLIIETLKGTVTPAMVASWIFGLKVQLIDELKKLAADTTNQVDDRIVAMVEDALLKCSPDVAFFCDLLKRGRVALVEWLRDKAALTETTIDDAAVDILAAALIPAVHAP